MSRLSPRGHTADSRELLMAVTSRKPLALVHDANMLMQHKSRDWCNHCTPLQCYWPQCEESADLACARGGAPTVPTRPRLSPWRRLVLLLTRIRASFR